MRTSEKQHINHRLRFPLWFSLIFILLMGAGYTVLDLLQPSEPLLTIFSFVPGAASFVALSATRHPQGTRSSYIRLRKLSIRGGVALGAATVLLLPILGSSSGFAGWRWIPALVYAPASGIAQELYFRASLLPVLESAVTSNPIYAVSLHSFVFVVFHLRTFFSIPSLPILLLVIVVLFSAGCAWGYEVQKDRTVVWAMVQHSVFLVVMSMFAWA
jgi:hypothetical protein